MPLSPIQTTSAYNPAAVAITGGTIDGTVIGSTTAAAGSFTSIRDSGLQSFGVVFSNVTHDLTTDNANFYWDVTNKRLGIGTNSPSAPLDVHITANPAFQATNVNAVQSTTGGANIAAGTDSGAAMAINNRLGGHNLNGAQDAIHTLVTAAAITGFASENWVAGAALGARMDFETILTGTTTRAARARIDGVGNFNILQQGLILPNVNVSGNILDWYEEGTFTPTVAFGGASVGVTYNAQIGKYQRVGNNVNYTLRVFLSSKGSSVGNLTVNGLPYAAGATYSYAGSIYFDSMSAATTAGLGYIGPSTSAVNIYIMGGGAAAAVQDTNCTNTSVFIITGSYQVA